MNVMNIKWPPTEYLIISQVDSRHWNIKTLKLLQHFPQVYRFYRILLPKHAFRISDKLKPFRPI